MRLQVTPKHFAYLKISEGCDRLCTFCAIPKMRGKHASKPMEDILIEARRLADSGVRELIVVAQDTTYYGIDMFGEPRLRQLLEQLDQVEGLDWIRLMYFYPMYIDRPLLETIGQSKRILPYIDMPLQHASNPVLKRMSRRVTRESTIEMVSMMRQTIPELVLRTTMITGFPGETDEQFEELVEFVDEMHFERLGVFTYSVESDTPASRLDEHLPERIKKERRKRLMEVQQKNAFEWCAKPADGGCRYELPQSSASSIPTRSQVRCWWSARNNRGTDWSAGALRVGTAANTFADRPSPIHHRFLRRESRHCRYRFRRRIDSASERTMATARTVDH
jgi:ribosomal protein S12 methylthiotransferase